VLTKLLTYNHVKNLASEFSRIQKDHKKELGYAGAINADVYKKMTLSQLESVSKAINTEETFEVHKRRFEIIFFDFYHAIERTENERELYKLFTDFKKEVDSRKGNFTKRGFLSSVGNFLSGSWDPYLGALSRILNKCLLVNSYRRGVLNEEHFMDFLKKPCEMVSFEGIHKDW
jgi:hypothetical protein